MFIVGQNSWVTVAEANTFFSDLWGGDFWATLSVAQKQQLLITAFNWINSSGYSISPTSTSVLVKNAQMMLAKEIYNSLPDYEKRQTLYASGVRSFSIEGFSETLAKQELPFNIQQLLNDFKTGGGGKFFEIERGYQ